MIQDLRGRLNAAITKYQEQDDATHSAIAAVDTAIDATARLIEQNKNATRVTRVAYSFRDGMTKGGEQATRTHDQIRDILENQLRMLKSVRAGLEHAQPLVQANASIAKAMIEVLGS